MKTWLAAVGFMLLMAWVPARAQQCYTPVQSWNAQYTLTGNAPSGTCQGKDVCSLDESSAGSGSLPVLYQSTCTALGWSGLRGRLGPTTVSLSAMITAPCPPPGGGSQTQTDGTPSGPYTLATLTLDVAGGSYAFTPNAVSADITHDSGCGSSTTTPATWAYYPITNWPQTITPLPAGIAPLKTGFSFSALAPPEIETALFGFDFTLTPVVKPDRDCKHRGGSSIGCQSQSLGEDVPIAGTPFQLHYESSRAPGVLGNAIAAADASMLGGWTLSIHHAYDPGSDTLFMGDGTQRSGVRLGTPLSFNGNLLVTSEDGAEVYEFNPSNGEHVETMRPLTGALVYQFAYDSSGRLLTVTDAAGKVTKIQRDASGHPTAIVAPFGQTTSLALDSHGFLAGITDPLGHAQTFVNSAGGALTSRKDANGNTYTYTYAYPGLLAKDADPAGGFTALARVTAPTGFGWTNTLKSAMGRTRRYQSTLTLPWAQDGTKPVTEQYLNTWSSGLQASLSSKFQSGQLSNAIKLPDGTASSETLGADPVWGIQTPVLISSTQTAGSLVETISGSRTTTLGTAGNPFSATGRTDTQTINGRTYRSVFTKSTSSYLDTSPAGRTETVGLDALERVTDTQVDGLLATALAYDSAGRLASTTQGTRTRTLGYDSDGYLASVTDPMKRTTSFTRDTAGHVLTMTLPDGRADGYSYDANGNLTSATPPGKSPHLFAYTPVDLPASYTPPAVPGTGATTYTYNLDRDLTSVARPGGVKISYGYDGAGRLVSVGAPTGTTTLTYSATTGKLAMEANPTESIAYAFNGPLPSTATWTGTVSGSVSRAWNNNFWAASESVDSANTVAFAYDQDGLVVKAGAMTIARTATNGLIVGTTLGVATDTRLYDGYGALAQYTASAAGSPLWSVKYTRDALGRITAKTETVGGTTNSYAYTYDLSGRLVRAVKNGVADVYAYDTNSNRLAGTVGGAHSAGTYDAQDRLTAYGPAAYAYTANGELATETVGSQKTSFTYDVFGNLTAVTLPTGTKLAYIVDPDNHRVGKMVNGTLKTGFLYDDDALVAQLNGTNQVVSRFVYATRTTVPDYMVATGVTYRIFSDERGSPVLIVNTATGAVAEQITYDEFGAVTADTNPGLQPFRFAGGLYDPDTGLLRFGARDYDPKVGRWTAKDPSLFAGDTTNLYEYGRGDPVDFVDPTGLDDVPDAGVPAAADEPDAGVWQTRKDRICAWVKKKIEKKLSKVPIAKIPGAEIDVSTDKPEVSVTTGVKVVAGGTTVAEGTATGALGVTPTANPAGPILYVDGQGNVSVLGITIWHGEVHKEFGDLSKTQVSHDLYKHAEDANRVCEDNCPESP